MDERKENLQLINDALNAGVKQMQSREGCHVDEKEIKRFIAFLFELGEGN